jgi:hypothetical protein
MLGFVLEAVLSFEKGEVAELAGLSIMSRKACLRDLLAHFPPKRNRTLDFYADRSAESHSL